MPPPPNPKRPEMVRLLREGLAHKEIAERLGVSEPLVAKVARQEGIVRGQGRRKGWRREAVLALAAEGLATEQIALELECSVRLVSHYLLEKRRTDEE